MSETASALIYVALACYAGGAYYAFAQSELWGWLLFPMGSLIAWAAEAEMKSYREAMGYAPKRDPPVTVEEEER